MTVNPLNNLLKIMEKDYSTEINKVKSDKSFSETFDYKMKEIEKDNKIAKKNKEEDKTDEKEDLKDINLLNIPIELKFNETMNKDNIIEIDLENKIRDIGLNYSSLNNINTYDEEIVIINEKKFNPNEIKLEIEENFTLESSEEIKLVLNENKKFEENINFDITDKKILENISIEIDKKELIAIDSGEAIDEILKEDLEETMNYEIKDIKVEKENSKLKNDNQEEVKFLHTDIKNENSVIKTDTNIKDNEIKTLSRKNINIVNDSIVNIIETIQDDDIKTMTVKLYPKELGNLDIVISMTDKELDIKLIVKNEDVKNIFTNNIEKFNLSNIKENINLQNINIEIKQDLNLDQNNKESKNRENLYRDNKKTKSNKKIETVDIEKKDLSSGISILA